MYNFRMYIPFGRNMDLLNKCIESIAPQIEEFSSYEGKKIVVINNSMKPIADKIVHADKVDIWELPFELVHAQEANWMIRDTYDKGLDFCATTHTDSELLPGAMATLIKGYDGVKGTKWYAMGIGSPIFVAFNPHFFVEENVWFDPFLFPFYYMDNHMGRIARFRGWSDTLVEGPPTTPLLKHVGSHILHEDPVFARKNNLAFPQQGVIYANIWGGLPGHETICDAYASGTLPRKE